MIIQQRYVILLYVTLLQGHKNLLNLLLYAEIKLINLVLDDSPLHFWQQNRFPTQKKYLNFFLVRIPLSIRKNYIHTPPLICSLYSNRNNNANSVNR